MSQSILKSLAIACGVVALVTMTFARPRLAPAITAQPSALADRDDATDRDEIEHPVHAETEQPEDDPIVAVIEVFMNGIFWFEAETLSGGRYLIEDLYTFPDHGGAGAVQIDGTTYYVSWL